MFTVVIPLYEKRAWIQRAIDSVCAQSIEPAAVPESTGPREPSADTPS